MLYKRKKWPNTTKLGVTLETGNTRFYVLRGSLEKIGDQTYGFQLFLSYLKNFMGEG